MLGSWGPRTSKLLRQGRDLDLRLATTLRSSATGLVNCDELIDTMTCSWRATATMTGAPETFARPAIRGAIATWSSSARGASVQ